MRKALFIVLAMLVIAGCGKTGPVGPEGPQGAKGDPGQTGPGLAEVMLQPGPGELCGKDNSIDSTIGNYGMQPMVAFGYSTASHSAARGLFYFDVAKAGLPAGATITDAILILHPSGGSTAGNLLSAHVYPVAKEWTETASTWSAATSVTNWNTPGGDFATANAIGSFYVDPATTAPIQVRLNATVVQGWLNGQINHGILIKSDDEGTADSEIGVFSRDYSVDPGKRPALKILYKTQ